MIMPGQDLVQASVDATLIPEAAHKFAQRALREHQRAEKDVMKAVEHIVKSGQNLLKAYDLCEWGQWEAFFEMHFKQKANPDDDARPLTLRTAQRYMQLARDWSQLIAEHPQGFTSQRQAFKALAAIARAEENRQPKTIEGKGAARCANASGKGAARCANGGKRTRTGPVWRASGPFVSEALRLINSVDETLSKLVSRGYPLELQAQTVHEGVERLRAMLNREIDEADALQAAGEGTFVFERPPTADTRPLSVDHESEDDHDN
jgi:hypothetical protein